MVQALQRPRSLDAFASTSSRFGASCAQSIAHVQGPTCMARPRPFLSPVRQTCSRSPKMAPVGPRHGTACPCG